MLGLVLMMDENLTELLEQVCGPTKIVYGNNGIFKSPPTPSQFLEILFINS